MSSSIDIPNTPKSEAMDIKSRTAGKAPAVASSASSYSSSPRTPEPASEATTPAQASSRKPQMLHQRRPSLLSSAILKQECTTINIADPESPPRLITYLSSSQGFAWNPEIFIPSYIDIDYEPLENRREPVIEIRLSDEEIRKMLPA